MPYMLIIHEVEASPTWKAVLDHAADIRKRAGIISYQLLRYHHNTNTIVHFSEWSSLDNARQFFESPELVEVRRTAGVKAPRFMYLHELARGPALNSRRMAAGHFSPSAPLQLHSVNYLRTFHHAVRRRVRYT